jgi:hypothetical protein
VAAAAAAVQSPLLPTDPVAPAPPPRLITRRWAAHTAWLNHSETALPDVWQGKASRPPTCTLTLPGLACSWPHLHQECWIMPQIRLHLLGKVLEHLQAARGGAQGCSSGPSQHSTCCNKLLLLLLLLLHSNMQQYSTAVCKRTRTRTRTQWTHRQANAKHHSIYNTSWAHINPCEVSSCGPPCPPR